MTSLEAFADNSKVSLIIIVIMNHLNKVILPKIIPWTFSDDELVSWTLGIIRKTAFGQRQKFRSVLIFWRIKK